MAGSVTLGSRTCIHCGKVVAADRRLYCNNCGLPFRELAPGEVPPRSDQPWLAAGPRRDAVISALLVAWFPFAIGVQMVVGMLLGWDPSVPGANQIIESLKFTVMATAYFGPFLVGIVLAWRAVRARLPAGWFALGLFGVIGNLGVIAIAAAFVIGEVTKPH